MGHWDFLLRLVLIWVIANLALLTYLIFQYLIRGMRGSDDDPATFRRRTGNRANPARILMIDRSPHFRSAPALKAKEWKVTDNIR
jgi:hypothetical protein